MKYYILTFTVTTGTHISIGTGQVRAESLVAAIAELREVLREKYPDDVIRVQHEGFTSDRELENVSA